MTFQAYSRINDKKIPVSYGSFLLVASHQVFHSFFNGDQCITVTYFQVTDQASSPLLPKTHSSINVCTNAFFYSTWLELIKGAELHVSASKSIYSLTDILLYILFVISLQNLLNFSFVSSFSLRNHILRSNSYCLIGYFCPSSSCP